MSKNATIICSTTHSVEFSNDFTLVFDEVNILNRCNEGAFCYILMILFNLNFIHSSICLSLLHC